MSSHTELLKIPPILRGFPCIVPAVLIITLQILTKHGLFFLRTISQVQRESQKPRHSFDLPWKNKHITNTVSNILGCSTSCDFPEEIFILWVFFFQSTKPNGLNWSEAAIYNTVFLMDHEIIWLNAFVLIALLCVLIFHDCLSKPATKINMEYHGQQSAFCV